MDRRGSEAVFVFGADPAKALHAQERMVRIVAGELRGRKIQVPAGRNTRPTSERARAGLFDWLGPNLAGTRVLDLYAGSGALGIEALSRGATWAVFVENDRAALRCLRRNLEDLDLGERSDLRAGDAIDAVSSLGASGDRFDLVFADPPYAGVEWERLSREPLLAGVLDSEGQVVVEHSARDETQPDPAGLLHQDRKLYGETAFERYALRSQE